MGSGSHSSEVRLYCQCHPSSMRSNLAMIYPGEGIEVKARHHGTNHVGSLSVAEVLRQLAGTVEGSAIVDFVRRQVSG